MTKAPLLLPLCLVVCCLLAAKGRADETKPAADDALTKKLTTAIERLHQQGSDRWTNPTDQVPTEWVDSRTGHRVVRLSKQAGSASLYFHQNACTHEGGKLLISTPRGLETVDLRTRKLKVVVPRQSYRMGGSSGVDLSVSTGPRIHRWNSQWRTCKARHSDRRETGRSSHS